MNNAARPPRSIRALFAVGLLLAHGVAASDPSGATSEQVVRVILQTSVGNIIVDVERDKAPASAASFLALVDEGWYRDAAFYRTVRADNDNGEPQIDVIQGGLMTDTDPLPPVPHEPTSDTGIQHTDGVISLARAAPGTASGAAFFICIGSQPALDAGGTRNPDRLGFAAFGHVSEGMDVVRKIHEREAQAPADSEYMQGQMLTEPVRILNARRLAEPAD